MSDGSKRSPLAELVFHAVRFSNWVAGQGICPVESEGVTEPENFLMSYSDATGDDDWEMADRNISKLVSDLEARLEKAEAERDGFRKMAAKFLEGERNIRNDALEEAAKVATEWRRKNLGRDLSKATFDPCGRWEGGEVYEEGRERDLIAGSILALRDKS